MLILGADKICSGLHKKQPTVINEIYFYNNLGVDRVCSGLHKKQPTVINETYFYNIFSGKSTSPVGVWSIDLPRDFDLNLQALVFTCTKVQVLRQSIQERTKWNLPKTAFKKFEGLWSALGRLYPFKYFKSCLPQILLGPFLNTVN